MSQAKSSDPNPTATPVLEYEAPGSNRWQAGTLTYTAGGLFVLFCWLLGGDFAYQLKERSVMPSLQVLLKQFQASDFVVGALIGSLPQVIGMFFGPIIAYRSDRHRGRLGRRIPYLLTITPITVAAMAGLAYSPAIGRALSASLPAGTIGDNTAVITCFAVFWTIFEFCAITGNSLLVALVNDVVPKQMIGRFFGLFRIFSVSAGIVFMWYLMGKVETQYVGVLLGIGAVYGVGFSLMCAFVREPHYPPPPPAAGGPIQAMGTYLRECFARPYYLWYFASIGASQLAVQPINLFSIYLAKSFGMDTATYGKYSAYQFTLSLTMSFFIGWFCDRFHSMRMMFVALGLHAVATFSAFFLVHDAPSFGIAHVICGSLAGFWVTVWYALNPALFPRPKFAQYFSAMTICFSACQLLGGFSFGYLFDRLDHQYRYMYVIAVGFDAVAIAFTIVVYRYFKLYGGQRNYVAPE